MKRLTRCLIRLYPASWHARYGEELEALLEDCHASLPDKFDLLKGALKMQLTLPTFPKLAIALSVVGMLAGLGASFLVTPRYVSTATLQLGDSFGSANADDPGQQVSQIANEVLSRTSLSATIQDPRLDLYQRDRSHIPLEDVIENMRRDVLIRPLPSSGQQYFAFMISFTYSDRIKAQSTVQAMVTKFLDSNILHQRIRLDGARRLRSGDQISRLEERIAILERRLGVESPGSDSDDESSWREAHNLSVLDPPSLPVEPLYPNSSYFMATGAGIGFAGACVIAVFRRKAPPTPFPAQTA
jgi:LPS O-antigen subunit length determinant protein (WzzB/FepE family)